MSGPVLEASAKGLGTSVRPLKVRGRSLREVRRVESVLVRRGLTPTCDSGT